MFFTLVPKKDEGLGHRLITIHEDLKVLCYQDNQYIWEREEALAFINHVQVVDLPGSHVFDTHTFVEDSNSNFYLLTSVFF